MRFAVVTLSPQSVEISRRVRGAWLRTVSRITRRLRPALSMWLRPVLWFVEFPSEAN